MTPISFSHQNIVPVSRFAPLVLVATTLTSWLSVFCIFSLAAFCDRASDRATRTCLAAAYFSPTALISVSRRRMPSMALCHWLTRSCRSACNCRNSSAVLSSSTYVVGCKRTPDKIEHVNILNGRAPSLLLQEVVSIVVCYCSPSTDCVLFSSQFSLKQDLDSVWPT